MKNLNVNLWALAIASAITFLPTLSFACDEVLNAKSISQLSFFDAVDCPWDAKSIDSKLSIDSAPQFRAEDYEEETLTPKPKSETDVVKSLMSFSSKSKIAPVVVVKPIAAPTSVQALLKQCSDQIEDVLTSATNTFGTKINPNLLKIVGIEHDVVNITNAGWEMGWMDDINVAGFYDYQTKAGESLQLDFTLNISYMQPFISCDDINLLVKN